jgi:alpha-1,6-mannosyltransferase
MFFCARSGGVKRYLLAKHAWLARRSPATRHSLLVPASSRVAAGVVQYMGACLPLADGYRFPLRRATWKKALMGLQPDVIEAGDPYVPGWAARDAADALGIPAVAFCHSDVQRLYAERAGKWTRLWSRSYVRSFYSGFDLVLAPSRAMLGSLAEAGVTNAVHQSLGVDTAVFHPAKRRADLRLQLCLPQQTRLLVYAGRFAKEKNLPVLIAAAERLGPDYHLLLIGGRRRESYGRNITLWPYQRNTEKLAVLLASCDAFIHGGEHETFGLVLAEAMACGLPVVAVNSGGIPEVADDEVGVLVPRATASQLSEGVTALFERGIERIAPLARERAERLFGWDATFTSLLSAYMQLIDAPHPNAAMTSRAAAWQSS